jgi:mono/diheme cytochrome c family protein
MNTIVLIHIIFAIIFLLIFGSKIILMMTSQEELLEKLNKVTKVPNMIVGTVFLVTGIYLLVKIGMGNLGGWFHLKLGLILVALPLGIIGMKKKSKIAGIISLILFVYVYALAETKSPDLNIGSSSGGVEVVGEKIYKKKCRICHGNDGDKGFSDATALSTSIIERDAMLAMIRKGKNAMPAFEEKLSEQEMSDVADFVLTLRKQ